MERWQTSKNILTECPFTVSSKASVSCLSFPFIQCQPDIYILCYEHCANIKLYYIYIINILFYNAVDDFMNTEHFFL